MGILYPPLRGRIAGFILQSVNYYTTNIQISSIVALNRLCVIERNIDVMYHSIYHHPMHPTHLTLIFHGQKVRTGRDALY